MPELGTRVAARYELVRLVKFDEVLAEYAAKDTVSGAMLSLFLVHVNMLSDPVFLGRFNRERRLLRSFRHDNSATIWEAGLTPKGYPYVVVERAEGEQLDEIIRRIGPLGDSASAFVASQVLASLAQAHAQNVPLRALTPDNVQVNWDGEANDRNSRPVVKVRGYGVMTTTHVKSDWAAPEAFATGHGSNTADLYSLGVVIVHMLTGERPARSETGHKIPIDLLEGPLGHVVARATAPNPDARYQTAGEMRDEVWDVFERLPTALQPLHSLEGEGSKTERVTRPDGHQSIETSRPPEIPAAAARSRGPALDVHNRPTPTEQTVSTDPADLNTPSDGPALPSSVRAAKIPTTPLPRFPKMTLLPRGGAAVSLDALKPPSPKPSSLKPTSPSKGASANVRVSGLPRLPIPPFKAQTPPAAKKQPGLSRSPLATTSSVPPPKPSPSSLSLPPVSGFAPSIASAIRGEPTQVISTRIKAPPLIPRPKPAQIVLDTTPTTPLPVSSGAPEPITSTAGVTDGPPHTPAPSRDRDVGFSARASALQFALPKAEPVKAPAIPLVRTPAPTRREPERVEALESTPELTPPQPRIISVGPGGDAAANTLRLPADILTERPPPTPDADSGEDPVEDLAEQTDLNEVSAPLEAMADERPTDWAQPHERGRVWTLRIGLAAALFLIVAIITPFLVGGSSDDNDGTQPAETGDGLEGAVAHIDQAAVSENTNPSGGARPDEHGGRLRTESSAPDSTSLGLADSDASPRLGPLIRQSPTSDWVEPTSGAEPSAELVAVLDGSTGLDRGQLDESTLTAPEQSLAGAYLLVLSLRQQRATAMRLEYAAEGRDVDPSSRATLTTVYNRMLADYRALGDCGEASIVFARATALADGGLIDGEALDGGTPCDSTEAAWSSTAFEVLLNRGTQAYEEAWSLPAGPDRHDLMRSAIEAYSTAEWLLRKALDGARISHSQFAEAEVTLDWLNLRLASVESSLQNCGLAQTSLDRVENADPTSWVVTRSAVAACNMRPTENGVVEPQTMHDLMAASQAAFERAHTPGPEVPLTQILLQITSRPSRARLYLNGELLGRTPFEGTVDVTDGDFELLLNKRDHHSTQINVSLDDVDGNVYERHIRLERRSPFGHLETLGDD